MKSALTITCLGAIALVAIGCSKKPDAPPPEVTGLAAVPSSAEVVIAIDVEKLVGSPIVTRAIEQLLMRDPQLAQSWEHVRDACKLDVGKQIKRAVIALGPPTAKAPGPVLMIATGAISETDLAACVRTLVGKGGGLLTAKAQGGRTLYQVKDQNRTMFFTFGSADTVLLATSDAFIVEALTGTKAIDHPELAAWMKLTNRNAAIWAIGRAGERVRAGLVRVTQGKVKAGPTAFVGSIDFKDGAKFDLGAVMASNADAKELESQVKAQLAALVMVAQLKSLGTTVQKLKISVDGNLVRFAAAMSMDDVNHVLSMLDDPAPPTQDSPPAAGSGSQAPGSGSAK